MGSNTLNLQQIGTQAGRCKNNQKRRLGIRIPPAFLSEPYDFFTSFGGGPSFVTLQWPLNSGAISVKPLMWFNMWGQPCSNQSYWSQATRTDRVLLKCTISRFWARRNPHFLEFSGAPSPFLRNYILIPIFLAEILSYRFSSVKNPQLCGVLVSKDTFLVPWKSEFAS